MPLSILIFWARRTHAPDLDISGMTERNQPLLAATVSFSGTVVLLLIQAPALTTTIMLGYSVGTLSSSWLIYDGKSAPTRWASQDRLSCSSLSLARGACCLDCLYRSSSGAGCYLKKHTLAQALVGSVAGFVLAAFGLWLVFVYSAPFAAH